jgi:hypothetical protein
MKKKTPLRKSRPFKELATHNGKVAVFGVKVYAAISLMVFLPLAW